METQNRRDFSKQILGTALNYFLLESLFSSQAFAKPVAPIANHWAKQLSEICNDLKLEKISSSLWQNQVEKLFNHIQLEELLKFIDFETLTKNFDYPDLGVNTKMITFPKLDGLPEKTVFIKKIFGMRKDRAIIPHGHSNMSSAHLVLKGEFALKHYDKVHEDEKNLFIKPTIEKIAKLGSSSSISDEKNNIHWFIANTETAFTFDVIMLDLGGKEYDIHNIDIEAGEKTRDGLIRAPKMDVQTALKKYGKQHH
jgi:hypothetical protein